MKGNLDRLVIAKQKQMSRDGKLFGEFIELALTKDDGKNLQYLLLNGWIDLSFQELGVSESMYQRMVYRLPEVVEKLNRDNGLVVCSLKGGLRNVAYTGVHLRLVAKGEEG